MSRWGPAVGRRAQLVRVFTAADVESYGELCGDRRAGEHVPEPLVAALFSRLLGVDLPGPGTNYLKQELEFLGRGEVGDELTATAEVTRVRPGKRLVDLRTSCVASDGRLLCRGRALVLAPAGPTGEPPHR